MKLSEIRQRQNTYVCKLCGHKLELRTIIHNKYGGQGIDLYCPACQRIEYGVEPEIYIIARDYVDEFEYNYFTDLEENSRTRMLNVGKVCEILAWSKKKYEENKDKNLKD